MKSANEQEGEGASVLLIHGLWMRALAMRPMAACLRERGFDVDRVDYASIARGPERCVEAVVERIRAHESRPLHLLGHSLGGLIALRAWARAQAAVPGRVVCLGSPLQGSHVARRLGTRAFSGWLLGRSRGMLSAGMTSLPARCEVGMVAGTRARGMGAVFAHLDPPHDGTVAVAETRIDGLADHVTIDASHSGLLFSAQAGELAANFFLSGRFAKR